MSIPFIKQYNITVLSPPSEGSLVKTTITGNQMVASIKYSNKSNNASPDSHTIKIYNLGKEAETTLRKKGSKLILRAGYTYETLTKVEDDGSNLPVVFIGEVVNTVINRTQFDTVTEITLSSAFTEKKNAIFSGNFTKATKLTSVLTSIAGQFGLPIEINLGDKDNITIKKDLAFSSGVGEILTSLCKQYQLNWYIYQDKVHFINIDQPSAVITNPLITIPPERIKGTVDWSTENNKDLTKSDIIKVKLTTFLTNQIILGSKFNVDIEGDTSTFEVESIVYLLDFYGDSWDTRITAKELEL